MMTVLSLTYIRPKAQVRPSRHRRAIAPITHDLRWGEKRSRGQAVYLMTCVCVCVKRKNTNILLDDSKLSRLCENGGSYAKCVCVCVSVCMCVFVSVDNAQSLCGVSIECGLCENRE